MNFPPLDAVEARVLGSLIEKELITPEHYPLSLNALVNACNQLSSREPVMTLGESEVSRALDQLRDKRLAVVITGGDSRHAPAIHRHVPLCPPEADHTEVKRQLANLRREFDDFRRMFE